MKLALVSNNRRDPKILKKYFEDLKRVFPWKSDKEIADMAKSFYAKKHRGQDT